MLVPTLALATLVLASPDTSSYTMRLNLHKGSVVKYKLSIDRTNPKESGEMFNTFSISRVEGNTMYMDCKIDKLKINGKDRTKDLRSVFGDQVATLPWTIYSRRTGTVTRRKINPGRPDVMNVLAEGGIYLSYFQRQDVKPGDTWNGSTTATGGCTGAKYNFKEVKTVDGRKLAYFDVTNIMFINPTDEQIGPMKMIVDLSTGLPTVVDYKVKNTTTGQVSHFRQTRV